MREKIALIDDYNNKDKIKTDGASTKTQNVYLFLKEKYGNEIERFFIKSWKKHPISNFIVINKILRKYKTIVILPNESRLKIYCLLFKKRVLKKMNNIIYMVVGGWLPLFLEKKQKYRRICMLFDGIFVETRKMTSLIKNLGLDNVFYSPVFSYQISDSKNDSFKIRDEPIPVCLFSRVEKSKGVVIAIDSIKKANSILKTSAFFLNIYGRMTADDERVFLNNYFQNNSSVCEYHGPVDSKDLFNRLNSNFLLLFPTYFWGEGFPATLLESYQSFLPVLASNWKYNNELVVEGETGFLVKPQDVDDLADKLVQCYKNKQDILKMREKCYIFSKQFSPEKCMDIVCQKIDSIFSGHN